MKQNEIINIRVFNYAIQIGYGQFSMDIIRPKPNEYGFYRYNIMMTNIPED